jgi:hypothetical protein
MPNDGRIIVVSAAPSLDLSLGNLGVAMPGGVYDNSTISSAIAIEPDGKILAGVAKVTRCDTFSFFVFVISLPFLRMMCLLVSISIPGAIYFIFASDAGFPQL